MTMRIVTEVNLEKSGETVLVTVDETGSYCLEVSGLKPKRFTPLDANDVIRVLADMLQDTMRP